MLNILLYSLEFLILRSKNRSNALPWCALPHKWQWYWEHFFFLISLSLFIFFSFIFISWGLITLQYCSGFCHTLTWISHGFTCVPHPNPPYHLPFHPIPWVFPVHQARARISCIQPGLLICFAIDNIHVSMLFSRNIPPSPSPTESKSLFFIAVSLFLFCI